MPWAQTRRINIAVFRAPYQEGRKPEVTALVRESQDFRPGCLPRPVASAYIKLCLLVQDGSTSFAYAPLSFLWKGDCLYVSIYYFLFNFPIHVLSGKPGHSPSYFMRGSVGFSTQAELSVQAVPPPRVGFSVIRPEEST